MSKFADKLPAFVSEKLLSRKEMPLNFIRFYAVGLILFIIPFTRDFFIFLIPLSLLLVISVILYFHRVWNAKTIIYFAIIAIASFFFEMAGTTTGDIFGIYQYDKGLGTQVNHTPLIIGLNWLFLVYASHDISERFLHKPVYRILLGSILMVLYDVIMEWVAPVMQMWHFETSYPPFQNFLAWFSAALVLHTGFELLKIRTCNLPARALFVIQMLFFVLVGLSSLAFPS